MRYEWLQARQIVLSRTSTAWHAVNLASQGISGTSAGENGAVGGYHLMPIE